MSENLVERLQLSVEVSEARRSVESLILATTEIAHQRDDLIDFLVMSGYPYDWAESPPSFFPKQLRHPLAEVWSLRDPSRTQAQHFAAFIEILGW